MNNCVLLLIEGENMFVFDNMYRFSSFYHFLFTIYIYFINIIKFFNLSIAKDVWDPAQRCFQSNAKAIIVAVFMALIMTRLEWFNNFQNKLVVKIKLSMCAQEVWWEKNGKNKILIYFLYFSTSMKVLKLNFNFQTR